MNKIQSLTAPECVQIKFGPLNDLSGLWAVDCKGTESFQSKDSVIEIALALPVFESAIRILLSEEKGLNQVRRISEQPWPQPRHLEHLQAKAHPLGSSTFPVAAT